MPDGEAEFNVAKEAGGCANPAIFGTQAEILLHRIYFSFLRDFKLSPSNGIPAAVLLIDPINNLDLTVCAPLSSISVSACDGLSVNEKRSNRK
jgi:hypothetical protein